MEFSNKVDLILQWRHQAGWQHRRTILFAFPFSIDDLKLLEIYILHAQTHLFHQAQAAAVKQFGH